MKRLKWTDEEIRIAKDMLHNGKRWQDIADKLDRNKESVRKKMNSLGYRKVELWKEKDIEKLIKLANDNVSYKDIAKIFCKSEATIATKLNRLGFKKQGIGFTEEELSQIRQMINKNYSNKKIANNLNRSIHTVTEQLRKMNYKQEFPYLYNIDEIVNGVKIVKKIKIEKGKSNIKGYVVQSIAYPNAETYTITESNLSRSITCAYSGNSPKRVCVENSLYSIVEARPYIIDIEYSKTIAPSYKKRVLNFKCPHCTQTFESTPINLVAKLKKGHEVCVVCNTNISYGQRAFESYQRYFMLGFESEKILDGLPNRRVDFINLDSGMWIEIQGAQHTDINSDWYYEAHKQDLEKRAFAKNNPQYNLIEIDMRVSNWEYFKEQINMCEYLPNITNKNEKFILKLIEQNKRYPIKEIITMYVDYGLPCRVIGDKFGYSHSTISNLLQQNNIKIKKSSDYKYQKKDYNYFFPVKDIVKEYNDGLSMYKLANKYETSRSTISQILKYANIEKRSVSESLLKGKTIPEDEIIKKYKDGYTRQSLSKKYSVSDSVIKRVLINRGVKIRSHSESHNTKKH